MTATTFLAEPLCFGPVRVYLGNQSGKYPDGNQVIVQGGDTRVAFDTPQVARHIGADLDGVDMVLLGHVHEDHMVALGRLPAAQVQVQVHAADLAAAQSWDGLARHYGYAPNVLTAVKAMIKRDFDYAPRPDATAYHDGALWELGGGVRVRAHHLPGHTAGHCALVEESTGVAFIGDIDLTGFGPYYGDATSSLADFQRSLQRVKDIEARVWVTSHHRGVLTDRAAFVQALTRFAARIDERNDKLLGYLREGPHALDALVTRRLLYPAGLDLPYVGAAERRSIAQHLTLLQAQAVVAQQPDGAWVLA
ncbi:MBL fold metallo-hydrolase [Ottowia sp.]|uniref:MBL fold metallo-hydrolase n=1 Tax=Ottowia sp. TaxID=1898956 RepID=UPI003A895AB3